MSLDTIRADLEVAHSRESVDAILKSAYAAGYSLRKLGDILGVSGEMIRVRLKRPVPVSMLRDYAPSERVAKREKRRHERVTRGRRILGIRTSAAVMNVPIETLNELQRLSELTTRVRGVTPLDDPARLAVEPFGELLWATIQKYEIPQGQLERALGKGRVTFTVWLRNHGYLKQMPSQKSYRGIHHDPKSIKPRPREIVVGGTCRKGHALTESDIVNNGGGRFTCGICRKNSSRARYQKRKAALRDIKSRQG